MNLTFISCANDGLQKVNSPIQISGGTATVSNNYMPCPKCGQGSRMLDFSFAVDMFGQEMVDYLLTPDVLNTLNDLRSLAQRMSFEELNLLYEFYSQNGAALEDAPSTISRLFAALKSDNATALLAWASFLLTILQVSGVIGAPNLSAEDIVKIVQEYEVQHPDEIPPQGDLPKSNISPEITKPPTQIDS